MTWLGSNRGELPGSVGESIPILLTVASYTICLLEINLKPAFHNTNNNAPSQLV